MLLSDKPTADYIDANFVATWKEVRPVPKVKIDFGNGRVMERTLVGNTVIYVALPDGTVVDAFPGVYTPEDFRTLISPALSAATKAMAMEPAKRADFLANWHKSKVDEMYSQEMVRTTTSKAFVESPLLESMTMFAQPPTTLSKAVVEAPILNATGLASKAPPFQGKSVFDAYASRVVDMSKKPATGEQLKARLRLPKDADAATLTAAVLKMDSQTNVKSVHPAVHLLLADPGPKTPDELCGTIFKQLLHVDIDDPYLGLRDFSMPGTPDH